MLVISVANTCLEIHGTELVKLEESLRSEFARRYIPYTEISATCPGRVMAVIHWTPGEKFEVLSNCYSSHGPDIYVVRGDFPKPYTNESALFFLLQVLARSLIKAGYLLLTDSVAFTARSKTILLLGFPHTGKSTIATIAVNMGFIVRSTENTILGNEGGRLKVVGGTRVLVFDPRVRDLYGVKVRSTGRTKHGYEVVDLDALASPPTGGDEDYIDRIYIIYTSFSARGASISPVMGRKVEKLTWYFATSLIKGLDYYEPRPLDMPIDQPVAETLDRFIKSVKENYSLKFYEAFGSPLDVLKAITGL